MRSTINLNNKTMSTIQKSEIIKQVASKTGGTLKDTENTINNFLATVQESLKKNDKVTFIGFGSFNAKNVPARKGRNPQTGKEITIAARRQVTFSVGADFKKKVN